jgi:hypothetical protein
MDFVKKLNDESYILRTGIGIYELKYGKWIFQNWVTFININKQIHDFKINLIV